MHIIRGSSGSSDYCHLTGTDCTRYPVTHLTETHTAGLCVCVNTSVHQQNTERPNNMTHLTLWTLGERRRRADLQKTDTVIEERRKYERSTDLLISPLFFLVFSLSVHFSVTSSCSFHVSMSLCLCVPEMTTSQTLWVRRLTARPAAATLETINAPEKTSARPLTPGSLSPTLAGWFGWEGLELGIRNFKMKLFAFSIQLRKVWTFTVLTPEFLCFSPRRNLVYWK